jgi:uncharacterized OB-fold protein
MNNPSIFRTVTSLSEDDFAKGKILYSMDKLDAQFAWDTGIAIGAYLRGFKQGKILGAVCHSCNKIIVPPRIVCEWCFRPISEFVPLQDTGFVNTFSLCYVTWDVQRIASPEIPAVIQIDGASKHHGILHKLGDVSPDQVHIGMKVQAVWKPPQERTGSITDIKYFRPIEGEKR